MVEAFYREGKQILLLSYTNRAVDEISKALASIEPEIDLSLIHIWSSVLREATVRLL